MLRGGPITLTSLEYDKFHHLILKDLTMNK